MPFAMKRKLFTFISENPLIAKLQYGRKVSYQTQSLLTLSHLVQITFIFILILFIDSVNRVYRVQLELHQASKSNNLAGFVFTSLNLRISLTD